MYRKMWLPILLIGMFAYSQQPPAKRPYAYHSNNWERLKSWAGEYPMPPVGFGPGKGNIFKDPDVARALLKLLGKSNYKRLMSDFQALAPIDVVQGYLVIEGLPNPRMTGRTESALVIFRLSNREVYVIFNPDIFDSSSLLEAFPATQSGPDLPQYMWDRAKGIGPC